MVRTLTLNRPEQRNAVSSAMLVELVRALVDLTVDPECRAVVLRGEGKDFCSGADMKELAEAIILSEELSRRSESAAL